MKVKEISIRSLLYEKGVTQTELAEQTGITRMTINAICNGKSCSRDTATKIADALDVDLEEIMR